MAKTKPLTFTRTLLNWYDKNKRDLPWRKTRDPYVIWVSEIIMQQTRIEQGLPYYYRFLESFPSLRQLADAAEEDVLNVWQGLGYYSRARNMHAAAKFILREHNGVFPEKYDDILQMKGVGKYTAAAITSMAFDLPYPVFDGNVLRFFSRFFGIISPVGQVKGKNRIHELAKQYIDKEHPGEFNQAIMEFGALQCKQGSPDCNPCPLKQDCFALNQGMIRELPVKSKVQLQRKRYFHYFVIFQKSTKRGKYLLLQKRESDDIWKNLYDFPLIESDKTVSEEKLRKMQRWEEIFSNSNILIFRKTKIYKHILTHQIIHARFYFISGPVMIKGNFKKVSLTEIHNFPVPRLIENFLQEEKFPDERVVTG